MNINPILIVDDNLDMIDLLEEQLSSVESEYSLIFDRAFDGDMAIQKAKSTKFSLILLDLNLPKKDGLTVLFHLREDNSLNKNTPVIIISGFISAITDDMKNVYRLSKPIEESDLISTLKKALNHT